MKLFNSAWRVPAINSMDDLQQRVSELGFLPMFSLGVRGYSVAEAVHGFWREDGDGPWEWKGPIIRGGECAYGKFFINKAVWISRELLPDFINYRRTKQYAKNEDIAALDDIVLQVIATEGQITSKDIARLLGMSGRRKKRQPGDLVDEAPVAKKISLDPILSRLMMGGRIVIADFVYNIDKRGNQYGWGIAKYSTPENLYGNIATENSPAESYERMFTHLKKSVPVISDDMIRCLLG